MRFRFCALELAFLLITLASARADASVFYPLGQGSIAKAVSPDGATVLVSMGSSSAVGLWTSSNGLKQIAIGEVFGRDISNNGVVVGLFCGSNLGTCYESFRWTSGSGVQGIGALPGSPINSESSDAFGISVDGSVVVGQSSSADGSQAYRWSIGGGMVGIGFLNTLEDRFSSAAAVSANGDVVVGSAGNDNIPQAFRWTQVAGMVGLGDLPGGNAESAATAVSANGQIVVGASESTSGTEAFRWTQATGMVGLGDLPGGDFRSTALATNTDGQIIVGESRGTLLNSEAFIWTESHGIRPLKSVLENEHGLGAALAGWQLFAAHDISDDGLTIVGHGQNPSGEFEGFVVVIPEPATIWLFIATAAVIFVAQRVRRVLPIWLAILCVVVSLASRDAHAAAFYPLGGFASSVSPDGAMVLVGRNVWTPAGGFVDILPGVSELYGGNLANGGIIAGMFCGPNTSSCYEAYRAPVGGPVQGLGALDDNSSHATAITPDGAVVAGFTSSATGTQSFRWTSATGMVGLGNLVPNANSHDIAYGVSADGSVIVGRSGDDLVHEAYRWTAAGGMIGLGDLPGGDFRSSARVVSADGFVVAGIGTTATGTEAFRWTQATGMVALGDLNPATVHTETTAMSVDGSAIYGLDEDAWVWTQATGMQKVQDVLVNDYGLGAQLAGWRIQAIDDVSDDGLVLVGNGLNPAGQSEGFAIVIPEPSSVSIFVAAAMMTAAIAASFRRRARPSR